MIIQSFEWTPKISEVEYLFHIIDIVHEFDGYLSIFKKYTPENRIKFAIKFGEASNLKKFKMRVSYRVTFTNWTEISLNELIQPRWIFSPEFHRPQTIKEVRKFISKVVQGYDVFVPVGMENMVIIPANESDFDTFSNELELNIPFIKGTNPTLAQMKQVIKKIITTNDRVTFFHSPRRWDAKIKISRSMLLIMTFSDIDDENNDCDFSLDGDIELAKPITQHIANLCGTMLLTGSHISTLLFEPKQNNA